MECCDCGAKIDVGLTAADADAAWNLRFAAQELASTAARLKEANAELEIYRRFHLKMRETPDDCRFYSDQLQLALAALRAMEGSDGK